MADSIVPLQGRQLSLLSKYNGDLILAMNFDIINPYSVFNHPSSIALYSATPFIYLISIISCWFWWSCTIQTTRSCYSLLFTLLLVIRLFFVHHSLVKYSSTWPFSCSCSSFIMNLLVKMVILSQEMEKFTFSTFQGYFVPSKGHLPPTFFI